jgi:crotonobetainyl-CoA:carnitine CoA-transferase CaiB-like acyl-CoA transferase
LDASSALSGLRVLDLSQVMAGPFCCMLLGDMGADVIKVEPPGGDQTRRSMGFRMKGSDSPGFLALNRNKRSIAIDLRKPAGKETFCRLVETADILVENSRPGVTKKLGIDYAKMAAINPRLIYASISGFGQTGPWSQRPGFDLIAQAMSGVISAMGLPGQAPVKSGISVGDLGAGLFTAYGVLSAVIARGKTGVGQYLDASLFEAALGLSIWEVTEFWATGVSPKPLGTANRMSAPYQAVRAKDGWLVIGAANEKLWSLLCDGIDRADLKTDARFIDNKARIQNRAELLDVLEPIFRLRTVEDWTTILLKIGVPAGPIFDFEQALNSDHVQARQMIQQMDHPVEGKIPTLGFPIKLSGTPQSIQRHPPLLGEHTDEILREIGWGERTSELRSVGAFST